MISLCFVIYLGLSLESVFGEDGISNNKSLQHNFSSDQATNTEKEYQNTSELTQEDMVADEEYQDVSELTQEDMVTDQEYQNISKLPQERHEKLQKLFSVPTALAIGGSILGLPVLGYTVYYRKKQNKHEPTLDTPETTEVKNELDSNIEEPNNQDPTLDQSETAEEKYKAYQEIKKATAGRTPKVNEKRKKVTWRTIDMPIIMEREREFDCNLEEPKKQEPALDTSEDTEEELEVDYNPNQDEKGQAELNSSDEMEGIKEVLLKPKQQKKHKKITYCHLTKIPKVDYKPKNREEPVLNISGIRNNKRVYCAWGKSIQELGILERQPRFQNHIYTYGLKLYEDKPMRWENGIDRIRYAFAKGKDNKLNQKKLNSSIWSVEPVRKRNQKKLDSSIRSGEPDDIYSPNVYGEFVWFLASPRRFDLPLYRIQTRRPKRYAVPIDYVFFLERNRRYCDILKPVYEPRLAELNEAEKSRLDGDSDKINDMIDDLLNDEENATIGRIQTNLPVGFVVIAVIRNLNHLSQTALYICAHDFDAETQKTTVSLAYRYVYHEEYIEDPLTAAKLIPRHILRHVLRTTARIALNTLPERKDTTDQFTELGTSVTDLALRDTTTLPVEEDTINGSA